MPQAVCINHTPDGGEVEQLQTHGQDDPSHDKPGPDSPCLVQLSISRYAKPRPEYVLDDTHNYIGCHVVRVVPAPAGQIHHVRDIQANTEHAPHPENILFGRAIQSKQPDWRVVQAI